MKKILIYFIFISILIFPSYVHADGPYLNIPPTNAFDKIHSDNGTIDAVNFSMPLNIKSGSGISVKSNNSTHTLTISNSALSSIQGTYNTTQANNALINSGGYKINFINGSGATVHVQDSKSGTQVNVTISATGSSSITSINSQTGPTITITCQSGNTTCTNSTNQIQVGLGSNVVVTNGVNQTISKALTFTSGNTLTVSPSPHRAGINIGSMASSPTTINNGDLFINTASVSVNTQISGNLKTMMDLQTNGQTASGSKTFSNNMTIATGQNIFMGTANVTTTAVRGFFYFSAVDGTPTGVPAAHTGSIPCVFDGKANKLWCYNGGWKSSQFS